MTTAERKLLVTLAAHLSYLLRKQGDLDGAAIVRRVANSMMNEEDYFEHVVQADGR